MSLWKGHKQEFSRYLWLDFFQHSTGLIIIVQLTGHRQVSSGFLPMAKQPVRMRDLSQQENAEHNTSEVSSQKCMKMSCSLLPVCLPPPFIRLGWVWVDVDGSVTVSDGSVGFLHLHINTERQTDIGNQHHSQWEIRSVKTKASWYLALLAYKMANFGLSLMASVKRSRAFCRSPEKSVCFVEPHVFIMNYYHN